jgi:hypothetical protein
MESKDERAVINVAWEFPGLDKMSLIKASC